MHAINYIISSVFDYSTMLADDSGPAYAKRQGWIPRALSSLAVRPDGEPILIDNRIDINECREVFRLVSRISRTPIYIKIVDPYWESIRSPYCQWLLKMCQLPNSIFFGPYHPVGISDLLRSLTNNDRYIQIPYAYQRERELTVDRNARKKWIAISGNRNSCYYPERAAMHKAIRGHWSLGRRLTLLPHPGYPDTGALLAHDICGEKYIRFLSEHNFMYVEPGRDGLEFLKYSECAYAGCVPIGRPALSLPAAARAVIQRFESESFVADFDAVVNLSEAKCEEISLIYRESLRRHRSPLLLNEQLIEHWRRNRSF